jgi:hypothetical protein
MDTAGMKDKAETGDTGETADRADKAGTGDREALRPRRNSNSNSNSSSNSRNIRRDGGHDRRDGDDRDGDENDDNDGASTCSLLDETSSARVQALNSPPGIGEGGAHLGMLIEAATA